MVRRSGRRSPNNRRAIPQGSRRRARCGSIQYAAGQAQPRPELPPGSLLRAGRLARRPQADAEPRPAVGRQHRQSARSDDQPDASRSCSQLNDPRAQRDHRRRRQAGADHAELEGVPAAARVRVRRQWRRAASVIRGGYGVFYDQLFQNLTLFSLSQSGPEIFSTLLNLTNTAVGVGQLASFRYGVDPLPSPPPPDFAVLPDRQRSAASTIRTRRSRTCRRCRSASSARIGDDWSLSSDYVHTRGTTSRASRSSTRASSRVCNPAFPGSTPGRSRGASRGVEHRATSTRRSSRAGLPRQPARADQHVHARPTSRASTAGRRRCAAASAAACCRSAMCWRTRGRGAASRPRRTAATASPSIPRSSSRGGVRPNPARRAPSLRRQRRVRAAWRASRSRRSSSGPARGPYSLNAGFDLDGDGLATVDRLCEGVDPTAVFAVRGQR